MRVAPVVLVALVALVVVACGGRSAARDGGVDGAQELTVFAAASLTEAFTELAERLEARNDGLQVTLNLAGSQTLATQLLEGAPADVFAAADARQMDRVAAAGLAGTPEVFATNGLAIAVAAGNPLGIGSLDDLAREDVLLVLPAEEVPAGAYAAAALEGAGVEAAPASLELDVRAALGKVVLGEADATIVYRSDLTGSDRDVEAVALPPAHDVAAHYPVATITDADNPRAAADFVALLHSDDGRRILQQHGFGAP